MLKGYLLIYENTNDKVFLYIVNLFCSLLDMLTKKTFYILGIDL